jgi:hypothetical protein
MDEMTKIRRKERKVVDYLATDPLNLRQIPGCPVQPIRLHVLLFGPYDIDHSRHKSRDFRPVDFAESLQRAAEHRLVYKEAHAPNVSINISKKAKRERF